MSRTRDEKVWCSKCGSVDPYEHGHSVGHRMMVYGLPECEGYVIRIYEKKSDDGGTTLWLQIIN